MQVSVCWTCLDIFLSVTSANCVLECNEAMFLLPSEYLKRLKNILDIAVAL